VSLTDFEDDVAAMRRQIVKARAALNAAIERFREDVRESRGAIGRSPRRHRWSAGRVAFPRAGRPVVRRVALPRQLRSPQPRTELERRRIIEALLHGGRPPIVEAVEGAAERAAAVIRGGLLALQSRLRALYRRNRLRSRIVTAVTRGR
jgi:hypothetical protein